MLKRVIKKILPQKVIDFYIAVNIMLYEYADKVSMYKAGLKVWGGELRLKSAQQLQLGNDVSIGAGSNIWIHCKEEIEQIYNEEKYDGKVIIGNNVHIGGNCKIDCYIKIVIERDCLLASGIAIIDSQHGMNPESDGSYVLQSMTAAPITIEEGVWIGENVTILSGSVIGRKAIIGAGAVVKGNIPPYTIAVGVPAKVVKKWNFENKKWEKV